MSTMQILITAIASAMLWIPLNHPLVCGAPSKGAKAHNKKHVQDEYFFWNELTGDVQWEGKVDTCKCYELDVHVEIEGGL